MKSIKVFGKELSPFAIRMITAELIAVVLLALLYRGLRDNAGAFSECLLKATHRLSLISLCLLGIEFFDALVRNRWRIKSADKVYPMFRALILMILNALAFLCTGPNEKTFVMFIVPLSIWLTEIVIISFYRWLGK